MSVVRRHTILRLRVPTSDDGHGNLEPDWSQTPTEEPLKGWAIDASTTSEDVVNRDGELADYTIRGPFGVDVISSDRIRLPFGLGEFVIVGEVLRQPGPSPFTSHTLIRLNRWEG